LRAYLHQPVGLEQARTILQQRLHRRGADFLSLVQQAVYRQPASPYLALLRLVGCEQGDLERLVRQAGVEGALQHLYRLGVFLTVDEFKGRRPAVRGSASIAVEPHRLHNPLVAPILFTRSSGSRGAPTPIPIQLPFLRDRAVNAYLTLDARGGGDWSKAVWSDPGGSLGLTLRFSGFGRPASRCFAMVSSAAPGLHPRYRWSARLLRLGGTLSGVRWPRQEFVPLDDPSTIVRWLADERQAGRVPHLWTYVSPALRICQSALEAGIDISGSQFTVTGEPLTATRLAAIRAAGAEAVPDYGMSEAGFVCYGCLAPEAPDDLHLMQDLHALIQVSVSASEARSVLPGGALLVTSLRPTAPIILLNVSMGDRAVVTERACGCPLARLGWSKHLHTVRSYEKLTAAGMSFIDSDVIRVLEEVLPARFGGGPQSYQLVEGESDEGQPRLRLLVDPAVGPLDTAAVADAFFSAVGGGSGPERMMELAWRSAGLLAVERSKPRALANGKVLHLYRDRSRPAAAGADDDLAPGSAV
jgi:hypothetical protein